MTGPQAPDVAVAAFLLLRPTSGQDSMPPRCWNAFGSEVDCSTATWPQARAAAVVLLVVMWLISVWHERRDRSSA